MHREYGHYWYRGMRWMNRPWRWGYRRACCCLFFTLPLLLVSILALAVLLLHFAGVNV